jgi:hypothetical protein
MITTKTQRILIAIALVAAAAGAQAAGPGARDPFTDGARSVSESRDPYTDGARSVQEPRSPYSDGAAKFDPYYDGAPSSTGLNLTDASAESAHHVESALTVPSPDAMPRSSRKSK